MLAGLRAGFSQTRVGACSGVTCGNRSTLARTSRSPGHSASTARRVRRPRPRRRVPGQHGEIAPGEMAVDAHVQAGELFGTPQSQDSAPARFGLGRFAPLPMHHRLAEQELGVLVVEAEPLGAGPQRLGRLAQHLVRPGDQGIQLPRDRVAGCRPRQAPAEVIERPAQSRRSMAIAPRLNRMNGSSGRPPRRGSSRY